MQLVFTTYEENNQLVGFTIVYPSSKVNWFWYFTVKEELRGQGFGQKICQSSSPKVFLASLFHLTLALGTGMPIPHSDFIAAALQTEPPHFAPIGRCHIGDNPTHHNVLDGLAVWARHGTDLLTEESTPFVHLGFIATFPTAIFKFPSHYNKAVKAICVKNIRDKVSNN